ncbi:endonuclease MutS2 [Diplocloster agilis]|uniref:endonuclease MutS2 n=1 Tax=Diplocloster agilis TaxID=2850323 RepID=UPI0008215843|nr:endonuclease MutS2 [Suonthocola fibrivorans]MCU6732131.1 endonuclease MutS2 [Suonthocola fibrivorans]SCI34538.1 MutS2 protein [uncultured Clostridium sp.]
MNAKALHTLEFHKIIDRLTEHAASQSGKDLCRHLAPSDDLSLIRLLQQQTADAFSRILKKGSPSFGGTKDVRGSLKRLEIGSSLNAIELLAVCTLLETAARAKSYGRKDNADLTRDSLDDYFDGLIPLSTISAEIRRCILSEEEISDEASSTLRQIRRSIKLANERIHTQLNSMVNGSVRTYLQDAVITMRDGRYCLPVKAEYRSQVSGMIHDQSSSGSTVFIEPMAVVRLNNDIKELLLKEQTEIEVILANLSTLVAEETQAVCNDFELLTELDFIFARAKLAQDYNGTAPVFNTQGYIYLRKARHPLLDSKQVVPIDIYLGKEFSQLIVTGPNTGGKTVSLKTVGLLTLMGQAGLHIPTLDRSELALFHQVYADIGDEQSIEQSLSTFSSHMTNIVKILEEVDDRSLVLFDELGAGTDPTEGAALAMSILSWLHQRDIRTMATTHYSELKVYALSTQGVENACCEFDIATLRPTYRLLIGIPGKSNAFAISSKLGLPDYIIDDARSRISETKENFEDLITDLENSKVTIEKEQVEITRYKEEIESLKTRLEQKYDKLDQRREDILREANEKAHAILREAKEVADQTISNFNKYGQGSISMKQMEQERAKLRDQMSGLEKNMTIRPKQKSGKANKPADFKIGDTVKVLSLNLKGTVSTLPNAKGDLYVQMGILRSQVNIKDLELVDEPVITGPNLQKTGSGKIKMSKSATVSPEIKLLGMTVDEALGALDKYLDDAYLAHIPQVRIVHGKGTGALRTAVHNHLKRTRYVKSYRLGAFGEGESGVTIVEFK